MQTTPTNTQAKNALFYCEELFQAYLEMDDSLNSLRARGIITQVEFIEKQASNLAEIKLKMGNVMVNLFIEPALFEKRELEMFR